ncbi:hypothetical protein RIF29_16273 [Crotalaria pallida]|uniref:Uncharacterized protein n=1 Tax=Crotalaria pallida TaxID=3830 RepID=A0AAN9FGB8_CROPI
MKSLLHIHVTLVKPKIKVHYLVKPGHNDLLEKCKGTILRWTVQGLQHKFHIIGSKHGHGGLKLARVRILISVEGI